MTKEMIQQKFSGLLELMALIQNDIENGLFDVAAESTTGARSMIAFNATRNVFMLMSDARPTRGPGRPKKAGPYAAELRGATIHPVVKEFTEWRLKNGLSQQKAVERQSPTARGRASATAARNGSRGYSLSSSSQLAM